MTDRSPPSFRGLRPSSAKASWTLSRSKAADTRCELLLRSELWRMGLRFRKNMKSLPGKPDIVFPRARVVVFCDGEFWHGRDWKARRKKLERGSNAPYWVAKIQANVDRDERIDEELRQLGWRVIRLWETEILTDPQETAVQVAEQVRLPMSRKD